MLMWAKIVPIPGTTKVHRVDENIGQLPWS
jgi:hypothetical protein